MTYLFVIAAVLVGSLARISVVRWDDPWGPHHPDEHILPLEALGLWEGVTPREVGWPGATTRLALSALEAGDYLLEQSDALWQHRHEPQRILADVAHWIGLKFVDPAPLYRLGRSVSVVTGILGLFVTVWSLRQWLGPGGVAAGTLTVALSPIAVAYSQYVLADVTGLLFATGLVGLAARATPARLVGMAVLAGLAASSKFHFLLWLLTPLLCIWLERDAEVAQKLRRSLWVVGLTLWVLITLVPWFWTNPLLPQKEFTATVLDKVGYWFPFPVQRVEPNTMLVFGGLGALGWFGAVVGAFEMRRIEFRRFAPVALPLLGGAIALALSAVVFDRYGVALIPGIALLAGLGWERALGSHGKRLYGAAAVAFTACLIMTALALVSAQQTAGEFDVDVLAKNWILSNVKRGERVAVQDESNAFLPRAHDQLRECVNRIDSPEAYRDKWPIEGQHVSLDAGQPMRLMVLNDELLYAYGCRRELDVQNDVGFYLVRYHEELRFDTLLELDVINEFRNGSRDVTGGVDVLVVNRPVDAGMPPTVMFRTRRGERVIYARSAQQASARHEP